MGQRVVSNLMPLRDDARNHRGVLLNPFTLEKERCPHSRVAQDAENRERRFPAREIVPFASERSAGRERTVMSRRSGREKRA
jgi:hypothetical protein